MDNDDRQRKVQAGKEKFAELMRKKSVQEEKKGKKKDKKKGQVQETEGVTSSAVVENNGKEVPNLPSSDVFRSSLEEMTDPKSSPSFESSLEEQLISEELVSTENNEDLLETKHAILELDQPPDRGILDVSILEEPFHTNSSSDGSGNEDSSQGFNLKIILGEYTKKLSEYKVALSRRDEVIHQLGERLEVSLQAQHEGQAEAALQAETLAQEISILRQQLVQAREMLSHQKSSTGVSPQEFLEAQNTAVLLRQESSRKDDLIKDLCSNLSHANGELEILRTEMGLELQLCQQKLNSLEKQCANDNEEESASDNAAVTAEVETDLSDIQIECTSELDQSSAGMIAKKEISRLICELSGDSAKLRVLEDLQVSMQLQEKLNVEIANLHNCIYEHTKGENDTCTDDSLSIYVPSENKSSFLLESKLSVLNSKMKSLVNSVSSSDQDCVGRALDYLMPVPEKTKCSTVDSLQNTVQIQKCLKDDLQNLKHIYSNHLDLQTDMELLRKTFLVLQASVQDSLQYEASQEEFIRIKLLNKELEKELTQLRDERDQFKLLVSQIKESLNDATLLIQELRVENSNLCNEMSHFRTDYDAAKNYLLNSALGLNDEMGDSVKLENCVICLSENLQKLKCDNVELNASVENLMETNNNLRIQVSEFKEKYENEKQEKELLAESYLHNSNQVFAEVLPSSPEQKVPVSEETSQTNSDCVLLPESSCQYDELNLKYEELVKEKVGLELQVNTMQSNTVSLSTYEAAQQEIHRLERAEMRLCAILEENDSLQKRVDHLEHDLNELLQSNSNWKKETNEIEQELMSKLIEMELMKGELEAQLQEKEMLIRSVQTSNEEYKGQLTETLETLHSLQNTLDVSDIWQSHKAQLIELASMKQRLQLEVESKLAMEASIAYYKTKCDQLETLHSAVREQLQQIRDQLQSVWNQQDSLRRELMESTLEKEQFQKEIISLRKQLEFMVTEKEAEGIQIQSVTLLGGCDSADKRTPAVSEQSSSIKEMFEQDSINSSFDYSDSLASECVDADIRKKQVLHEHIVHGQKLDSNSEEYPAFGKDKNTDAHLQFALDLRGLHISDLQLQLLQAKMEQNNQHCLQGLEIQEQQLEQQRQQSKKNMDVIMEVMAAMESHYDKNKENALKELTQFWEKKHTKEVHMIHDKHKKELENLMYHNPLMSSNNNKDENVQSLKYHALQILESQKQTHLLSLEQVLRLENIKYLEKCKTSIVDSVQKELQEQCEILENENKTLKEVIRGLPCANITTDQCTEDSSQLLEKFVSQLNSELLQHSLMFQSKWSRWFSETLDARKGNLPLHNSDRPLEVDPVQYISQLTFEMKENETWLQVSSAMQEAVQLYVNHLSTLKTAIANEATSLVKLKSDLQGYLYNSSSTSTQTELPESSTEIVNLLESVESFNSTKCLADTDQATNTSLIFIDSTPAMLSDSELQTLYKDISSLREEIATIQKNHAEELLSIEEKHGKNILEMTNKANQETEAEVDLLRKQQTKAFQEIELKSLSSMETLRERCDIVKEDIISRLMEKQPFDESGERSQHLSDFNVLSEEFSRQKLEIVNTLTDKIEMEVKQIAENHLADLNAIKEKLIGHVGVVNEFNKGYTMALKEKKAGEEKEVDQKDDNTENISQGKCLLNGVKETNENKESDLKNGHDAETNNLLIQLKEHFAAEKAALVSSYEAKIEDLVKKHAQEMQEIVVRSKDELESQNQRLLNKMEELRSEHLQKEAELKQQIETIIEDHVIELEELERKTAQKEMEMRNDLQSVIDKLHAELGDYKKRLDTETNWEIEYNKLLPVHEETLGEVKNLELKLAKQADKHQLELENKVQEIQSQLTTDNNRLIEEAVAKTKEELELVQVTCLAEQEMKYSCEIKNLMSRLSNKDVETNNQIALLVDKHQKDILLLEQKLVEGSEKETLYAKVCAEHEGMLKDYNKLQEEMEDKLILLDQVKVKDSKLILLSEELETLRLQHERNSNEGSEKHSLEISELKIQHAEELKFSLDELKNKIQQENTNHLRQHSKDIAVWERRFNGVRELLTAILVKLLETCIKLQCESEDNQEDLLIESQRILGAYAEELDVLLGNKAEVDIQDKSLKIQQNMMLDLDNFIHERLHVPPSDISFLGKRKELERNNAAVLCKKCHACLTTVDMSTSTDDLNDMQEYPDTFAEVEKLRIEIQQNMTEHDLENESMARDIKSLTSQISELESQNVSLKQELSDLKLVSTKRPTPPVTRDWLAGTELSSVEIDSWQVHAAQTNSRLLHVLSDLVKTFVDTEQNIQRCLARLGLSVFQTSDSGNLHDEDGPPSGQFHYGSREDFSSMWQQSGESAITFEMCEDGLDLTPRAWDLFASAFKSQDVQPEDDVVLGASRRLRLAVDQVLCLLSELMELQSLQDLSLLHQRNEDLIAELKEEEKAKMEAQAKSLKLENDLHSLEQELKSLKEKLEESVQHSQSLWHELEGAKSRLGQLEVTHEGLTEEKRLLQEQSHLLASGLQDTEQRTSLGEEEICDDLLLGHPPELVAENSRLLGEKRTLQEKQEYERQQLSRRLHHVELALEEAIAQREELQEKLGSEIVDLKSQMEAMEKQLNSNKKFIEEQGQDREQEREEYSKEIRNLKEAIKEKDRNQNSEVTLSKEVESLEIQLRSNSELFKEACERRDELEAKTQQQRDKISDLQEVISELEKQLEDRVRKEKGLTEQIEIIRMEMSENDRQQDELSEHVSALEESQMTMEQGQHIRELEEQLESRNQEIQQLKHYHTLIQEFRGQLHVLDERVESKSRQLERFTWVCSLSPVPSEDTTSASDYRDPDKAILLIQEGGRVLSPASAHWEELKALENRIDTLLSATEELMRRYKELETQYKSMRTNQEEIALERSILQEQLNDQFLQISTLKNRLEEKRFGGISQGTKASVAMEMTQLREELQDATAKCESLTRTLQETKSRLNFAQHQAQERGEHVNHLQEQLQQVQAQADEHFNTMQQLQDRLEEVKKGYEFKLQFTEPYKSKTVVDNFTQSGDGSPRDMYEDMCEMNWKIVCCDSSVQVGTPFNQLDIIPEIEEVSSEQESFHSLKVKERLRSENRSLRKQSQALEEQSQLQKDFNTLQVMVSEKEEELTTLSQDVEEQELLKHEIDQLHLSLSDKEKEQSAQQQSLNLLSKEIVTLQQEAQNTALEISQLKEALDCKTAQLDSWQTAAQEHKLRAEQLKQSLASLSLERATESKSAEFTRLSLEQEVGRLQKEAADWSSQCQRELEKRQQEINRLEAERDGLKQALDSTNQKLEERESGAQKSRRELELKALNEQRAHQEHLIQQMQQEHAEKMSASENQVQVLLAKLQAAREGQEADKAMHKETVKNLLDGHQQELQALAKDKQKDMLETSQQVSALREEVQRLRSQLMSEQHQSLLLLHQTSRESTPDSDGTTMSSSCNSTGADEGLQLLPHHIQKLCNRLLKEGKEVLSLSHQVRQTGAPSPKKEAIMQTPSCPDLDQLIERPKDRGDSDVQSYKEIQCNLLALPATLSHSLIVAKDKLIEKADWLQRMTCEDLFCSEEELIELVKVLFSQERQWLSEQMEVLLTFFTSLSEQLMSSDLPINLDQLLTRDWWDDRVHLLLERHGTLINQLVAAIETPVPSVSSDSRHLLNPHHSPEMALLMEQLESCKWQIQKQKELLEYSQHHEESQRKEFQSHLEQEKINSSQLSSQLREWRKRCSHMETALSAKQNEVIKLTQALDQTRRDFDHCRSDLDLEKFHGQQLVHALDSERRNFHQVHSALYSERQRKDTAHKKDIQIIQHLQSVLHAHGLSDKVSPLSTSLATSPLPFPLDPPELFRHATSLHSIGNSLASFALAPESMECMKCSLRAQQSSLLRKKDQESRFSPDLTLQSPQMAIEVFRLRRHRDSLCFQKQYLLRLLCQYQETEAASLSVLDRMGVCTPPPTALQHPVVESPWRKCKSFRTVSLVVLSVVRLMKLGEVLKELRVRQQSHTEGYSGGRQRWRYGLASSQGALVPSPLSSNSTHEAASLESPRNGLTSPPWQTTSPSREKSSQNSECASNSFAENNSDSFSTRTIHSDKSMLDQRSVNDRRFEECVERLEYLHERMGLNTS